jgi:hypothetical protein
MADALLINIRLSEPYWRSAGRRDLQLELPYGSRLKDLLALLFERFPSLEHEMVDAPPAIFVGDSEADPDTKLETDSLVHFVWPIAGG